MPFALSGMEVVLQALPTGDSFQQQGIAGVERRLFHRHERAGIESAHGTGVELVKTPKGIWWAVPTLRIFLVLSPIGKGARG